MGGKNATITQPTAIQDYNAAFKLDRKESEGLYETIIAMYSSGVLPTRQTAIDYLQGYKAHYKKHIQLVDKFLTKLNKNKT